MGMVNAVTLAALLWVHYGDCDKPNGPYGSGMDFIIVSVRTVLLLLCK